MKEPLGLTIKFSVTASYMDSKGCVLNNLEVQVICNEELFDDSRMASVTKANDKGMLEESEDNYFINLNFF